MADTQVADRSSAPVQRPDEVESVFIDYFDTDETFQYWLPDGVSWVEHKLLTEGDRQKYLSKTSRELRVQRQTQDMFFNPGAGEDRKAVLEVALVGWNLRRKDRKNGRLEPVPFNPNELARFITNANPAVLEGIEDDIRRKNPWLSVDVSVADIDREIERLNDLRAEKVKEQEGNAGSSDK